MELFIPYLLISQEHNSIVWYVMFDIRILEYGNATPKTFLNVNALFHVAFSSIVRAMK